MSASNVVGHRIELLAQRFGPFGERSTQDDLADILGVARPTISTWKKRPTRGMVKAWRKLPGYGETESPGLAERLDRWVRGEGTDDEMPRPGQATDFPPVEPQAAQPLDLAKVRDAWRAAYERALNGIPLPPGETMLILSYFELAYRGKISIPA